MLYTDYFKKFVENDNEEVIQFVPNSCAEAFLLENAPRLYCPDETIQETFAFRTWTMRKHIKKTDCGFLLTEFLTNIQLPWAGKHNTINAALTHHLNEFRWLKNSDMFLDYIDFFINGEGSSSKSASAFSYHTPALSAMYNFCILTANENFLKENVNAFENYFSTWEKRHLTENALYWSIDDREGTEFSISGTTGDLKVLKGFRPLMNSCMYGDAVALSKIEALTGDRKKEGYYLDKAQIIKDAINKKMWDGRFYKAIHPLEQNLDTQIDYHDIPDECNARELLGYIPWIYHVPDEAKGELFCLLKDEKVFCGKTGFTTADISNRRFLYYKERTCSWNGFVWPYATSYAINATIELLNYYHQSEITPSDLYDFIKKYAEMHKSNEDGKIINFIDEVMLPYEYVWYVREKAKNTDYKPTGGKNRGRDYNHSTFIDLVLRGLCGVNADENGLAIEPKICGIWKWFKIENLTVRKQTYTVYYDEDGSVYGKGKGVTIEKA